MLHLAETNILQDSEFMSANKMFEAKTKLFTKPKQMSSIQSGDMQKLNRYFMEGQNTDGVCKDADKLVGLFGFRCDSFASRATNNNNNSHIAKEMWQSTHPENLVIT